MLSLEPVIGYFIYYSRVRFIYYSLMPASNPLMSAILLVPWFTPNLLTAMFGGSLFISTANSSFSVNRHCMILSHITGLVVRELLCNHGATKFPCGM